MQKQLLFITIIIGIISTSCSYYDSNAVNKNLLQGRWILKATDKDSAFVNYHGDSILFIFKGDTCTERIINTEHEENYLMKINNYQLELSLNTDIVDRFNIIFLSSDSLVLGKNKNWWQYKKISPTKIVEPTDREE